VRTCFCTAIVQSSFGLVCEASTDAYCGWRCCVTTEGGTKAVADEQDSASSDSVNLIVAMVKRLIVNGFDEFDYVWFSIGFISNLSDVSRRR
jgi:hypothetical protein